MMNPPDDPELKLYSGDVFLTICVVHTKTEASSIEELEQDTLKAVRGLFSTDSSEIASINIELEDSDLMQVNREPDWWDKVDAARDHLKNE